MCDAASYKLQYDFHSRIISFFHSSANDSIDPRFYPSISFMTFQTKYSFF